MENLFNWIVTDYFTGLIDSFIDPRKRVSVIYLLSSIALVLCWSFWVKKKNSGQVCDQVIKDLFSRKIWFSLSVRTDLLMIIINRAIMLMVSPLLISRIALTTGLFYFLNSHFENGHGIFISLPYWIAPLAYTLFLFLLDDFSRFAVHKAFHKLPFLWIIHKVHHSAEYLTPLTVYRTHPLEGLIFTLRSILVQSITISSFVFLFGIKIDLMAIYGVSFLLFIFNLTGANLRHSHFHISYGLFIEKIFISPAQHQIHHSISAKHKDKNFGSILAVWDLLGRSLYLASSNQKIKFGIKNKQNLYLHKLSTVYVYPLIELGNWIIGSFILKKRYKRLDKKIVLTSKVASTIMVVCVSFAGILGYPTTLAAKSINIYSHRQPFLIDPFLKAFQNETGITANIIYSSKGLAQRMLAEGKRSPADVVLTVDISRLNVYTDKNLLIPIQSNILLNNIPRHLRDKNSRWFGFSKRARVLAVAVDRVDVARLKDIEDLANTEWRGRICSRPGSHVYNRALLSSIIAANGKAAAEKWAKSLVLNLAQRPQGNDRSQVKAIAQGVCDIAIINSYYFGKLRNSRILEQRDWAKNVGIIFTNQLGRGNHINISGGGVARYSKNKSLAIKFLEFLSEEKAQKLFSQINYEFPGNPNVAYSKELLSWGNFSEDKLPIARIAEIAPMAQRIIDRVGW